MIVFYSLHDKQRRLYEFTYAVDELSRDVIERRGGGVVRISRLAGVPCFLDGVCLPFAYPSLENFARNSPGLWSLCTDRE